MATPHPLNLHFTSDQALIHTPVWSGPQHVKILVTTRIGGLSQAPYTSWNLGEHVGDDANCVSANRLLLTRHIGKIPFWLNQVHATDVYVLSHANISSNLSSDHPVPAADGLVTQSRDYFLPILTADCLPILLCDAQGDVIAACHAGWRGLANGIIQNTVKAMAKMVTPQRMTQFYAGLHAYIGPAIGQPHFEVGSIVRNTFAAHWSEKVLQDFFQAGVQADKYQADLLGLAIHTLKSIGIEAISSEQHCCATDVEHFYSYRKASITGRFASCIWLE